MNLGRCIANLLRQYPEVRVPGIGIFKTRYIPASFDEKQSIFFPPVNHIELVEEQMSGFPITDYVKVQQQVDEMTAERMLNEAVQEVVDALSRNGRALLEGLGYLIADGASIVFKPFETKGFDWKTVKEVTRPIIEEIAIAEEEQIADVVAGADYSHKRPITAWLVAAVLLLLLSATGLAWYYNPQWFDRARLTQFFGSATQPENVPEDRGPAGQVVAADSVIADSISEGSAIQLPDTVSGNAIVDTIVEAVPEEPLELAVSYEIIVGSFATMKQAEKYVAEMKARGYNLKALNSRMPGNRKKISWGSFATEEEAYRELARVKKNFEPTAWIAKVERD